MASRIVHIELRTRGRGLLDFTEKVAAVVAAGELAEGLCTLFVRHTSASLVVQENADPTVQSDLERFFARLVPDGDRIFEHDAEGPDDMPAHVRAALTATSLGIPFAKKRLLLGTWQGIYLYEHRHAPHTREVVVHLG